MSYELKGSLTKIGDVQEFKNNFRKRDIVITTEGDYPQPIKLTLINDKCDLVDGKKVGSDAHAWFNLRGNEYNSNFYVDLQCWKLESSGAQSNAPASSADDMPMDEDNSDVPF